MDQDGCGCYCRRCVLHDDCGGCLTWHGAKPTCEWSWGYTDFDGTRAMAVCGAWADTTIHWIEGTAHTCVAHAPEMRTEIARTTANMNWHRGFNGDLP